LQAFSASLLYICSFAVFFSNGRDPVLERRFRPVTTKSLGDLDDFRLKHRTFGSCSCMRWRMRSAEFSRTTKSIHMRAFDALIEGGTPVGVLGYLDEVPIGWCSIAPIQFLPGLERQVHDALHEEEGVWAVTCFYVDYRHRRRGIALRLLRAAVEYAGAQAPGHAQHRGIARERILQICCLYLNILHECRKMRSSGPRGGLKAQ
jgi:GNAT superfamily N-acetyltransferase